MANPRLSRTASRQVLALMREMAADAAQHASEYDDIGSLTRSAWSGLAGWLSSNAGTESEALLPSNLFKNAIEQAKQRRSA